MEYSNVILRINSDNERAIVMKVIEVRNLIRNYKTQEQEVKVLKGLNFSVEEQEFVGIMGRSGCGKTTLLKVLGLIEWPTEGKLLMWEKDTDFLTVDDEAALRRERIGFIFQDFFLMDTLSIKENMMLPMAISEKPEKEIEEAVEAYANAFGIKHLLDKAPYEVSGGERQRAAICRSLMNAPDLILADEPTGNLDSKSGDIVIKELKRINEEYGKTIFMVTHDPKVASHCKKVIFLKDGKIIETLKRRGTCAEFYEDVLRGMELL